MLQAFGCIRGSVASDPHAASTLPRVGYDSWNGMQGAQSFLFWFVVILWTVYNTLTTPFRCG